MCHTDTSILFQRHAEPRQTKKNTKHKCVQSPSPVHFTRRSWRCAELRRRDGRYPRARGQGNNPIQSLAQNNTHHTVLRRSHQLRRCILLTRRLHAVYLTSPLRELLNSLTHAVNSHGSQHSSFMALVVGWTWRSRPRPRHLPLPSTHLPPPQQARCASHS